MSLDFSAQPLWVNLAVFAAGAAAVWWSGTNLAAHADTIAERTGLTRGFVGLVLLAAATSLPEIATTVSAARLGAAEMATNNLLGGVAMQTAVLAVVDALAVRRALTAIAPGAALLLQGVVLILLLGATIAGTVAELPALGHVGLGTALVFGLFLLGLFGARAYEKRPAWVTRVPIKPVGAGSPDDDRPSLRRAALLFGAFALVTLAGGWAVASTGHALASQTGLGESFVGATLVAASTSLPELSTSYGAARRGAFAMAVSNVLGSNCFDVALLFVADLAFTGGPILRLADHSAVFAGALGVVLVSIYLWGLLERRDKPLARLGIDSWVVVVVYVLGLVVLYGLRGRA